MAKDGSLANLYVQMREQKAVDKILEKAQIEEVEVEEAGSRRRLTHGSEADAVADGFERASLAAACTCPCPRLSCE